MLWRDDVLQAVHLTAQDHERGHHREAREHGAGDEVRWEDGGVPTGYDRGAKSKRTIECIESTSGVESPARSKYARS
jgi:hypothetical protein